MEKKRKKKKEYWMFTLITQYKAYVNCCFDEFPCMDELKAECLKKNSGTFAILNITKLTQEQYLTLFSKEEEKA